MVPFVFLVGPHIYDVAGFVPFKSSKLTEDIFRVCALDFHHGVKLEAVHSAKTCCAQDT